MYDGTLGFKELTAAFFFTSASTVCFLTLVRCGAFTLMDVKASVLTPMEAQLAVEEEDYSFSEDAFHSSISRKIQLL